MKKISVVIPCYNEEENIEFAYLSVREKLAALQGYEYEILFLDNASTDTTVEKLRTLASQDEQVKIIVNNRNFGPECSLFNGILQSNGDAVIYLACDMQDPPALIPDFIKNWEEGAKVVWGQKTASKETALMYSLRTLYYSLIHQLSSIKQYPHVTGFGLYDKSVVAQLRGLKDPWPMLRHIIPNLGYEPILIRFTQPARQHGKSSYNLVRYFDTALNSLVHTSKAPLKIAIYSGLFCGFISFCLGMIYLVMKLCFWNDFSMGTAPILLSTFFVASVQLVFLGILGEYVIAILDRVSFTRHVYEKEKINFESKGKES